MQNLVREIPNKRIVHIYREANQCVDTLTKLSASSLDSFLIFLYPSLEMESILALIKLVYVVIDLLIPKFNEIYFADKKKKTCGCGVRRDKSNTNKRTLFYPLFFTLQIFKKIIAAWARESTINKLESPFERFNKHMMIFK